jgi:hypothetical protein
MMLDTNRFEPSFCIEPNCRNDTVGTCIDKRAYPNPDPGPRERLPFCRQVCLTSLKSRLEHTSTRRLRYFRDVTRADTEVRHVLLVANLQGARVQSSRPSMSCKDSNERDKRSSRKDYSTGKLC